MVGNLATLTESRCARVARYPDAISPARMIFQLTCRDNVGSLPPSPRPVENIPGYRDRHSDDHDQLIGVIPE